MSSFSERQVRESMPAGLDLVEVDVQEMQTEYGCNIESRVDVLDQGGVELIMSETVNAGKFTLRNMLDRSETGRMTLIIPPVGGIQIAKRLLNELNAEGFTDFQKVDFVYAFSNGSGENKTMSCWKSLQGKSQPISNSELLNQPSLMMEDIIDSLKTYAMAREFFPNLISIAPVGKGKDVNGEKSTMQYFNKRFGANSDVKLEITPTTFREIDINIPSMYITQIVKNMWIHTAFGMDGGSEVVRSLTDLSLDIFKFPNFMRLVHNSSNVSIASVVEAFERMSTVSINGTVNESNLEIYLSLIAENQVLFNEIDFHRVVQIIEQNKIRKMNMDVHSRNVSSIREIVRNLDTIFSEFATQLIAVEA